MPATDNNTVRGSEHLDFKKSNWIWVQGNGCRKYHPHKTMFRELQRKIMAIKPRSEIRATNPYKIIPIKPWRQQVQLNLVRTYCEASRRAKEKSLDVIYFQVQKGKSFSFWGNKKLSKTLQRRKIISLNIGKRSI